MALVRNNSLTQGLSGAVGDMLVFKQMRGKTYVTRKARKPTKQSEQQRENRNKFKLASMYAKASMLDAERKAYYWRKAKKLELPNAYTAAIADYMRKGEIKEVDTKRFKGKAGDKITIHVSKKDFAVQQVSVLLHDGRGNVIESNAAIKSEPTVFSYRLQQSLAPDIPVMIRVMIGGSHNVMKEVKVDIL